MLGCPLDDQLASRPGWVGIVLHPYTAGNFAQPTARAAKPGGAGGEAGRVGKAGGSEHRHADGSEISFGLLLE